MVTVTLASRLKVLKRLRRKLEDHRKRICETTDSGRSPFLSPDDLGRCGIQALRVHTTNEGIPQFDPGFFQPQSAETIQKHENDFSKNIRLSQATRQRTRNR